MIERTYCHLQRISRVNRQAASAYKHVPLQENPRLWSKL